MIPLLARSAHLAGTWYPAAADEVREFVEEACALDIGAEAPDEGAAAVIVPHAGWRFSGAIAARAIDAALSASLDAPSWRDARVLLLGAVHVRGVAVPTLDAEREWRTPLGALARDYEFEERLLATRLLRRDGRVHDAEHSLEVLAPLLHALSEGLPPRMVPMLVPPDERALRLGRLLAELAEDAPTLVIASSDLTHYGERFYGHAPHGVGEPAVRWARENDTRLLRAITALDAERVLDLAREQRSACGAGAIAAGIQFARARGVRQGRLLEHAQSYALAGESIERARDFVGYGSVLL